MKVIKEYKNWITKVISYIRKNETSASSTSVDEEISEMIEFEMNLASLRNVPDKYELITLKDFMKYTRINWKEGLNLLFKTKKLSYQDVIIINCRNYVKQLLNLINRTKSRTISRTVYISLSFSKINLF